MEAKVIRPKVHEIQKRFFQALDLLIESGKIKGLLPFCNEYGLHRPKYSNIRKLMQQNEHGTGYKLIDIDALYYLVDDYNISADWLLTGRGGMFRI